MNNERQLELELTKRTTQANRPPTRRRARATWWFTQMRQMVDTAMDWHAATTPRPEQIWLVQHKSGIMS